MPEIKSSFLQGKMNKDLDERLLPNGQYRDATNVEVSTSEDSNVGVVKNVLGNYRVEDIIDTDQFTCVGSIADEKTNKIYWFVSGASFQTQSDAIVEYDVVNDTTSPVVVDTKAGTSKAVLKFSGNIITGINIIDNLLFWTDNNSEPKKINIEECKKGTVDMDTHTQLSFENGSFDGITLSLLTNWSGNDASHAASFTENYKNGRYVWVETKQLKALLGVDDLVHDSVYSIRQYRDNKFLGLINIRVKHDSGGARFHWEDDPHWLDPVLTTFDKWRLGDVIFGNNIAIDIEERHVTVVKPKPLNTLSVKINHSESGSTSNTPNLFETKLPRFSYRYKFKDGEYSSFAPFTTPVFNAKYPKDPSASFNTSIFYNEDNIYDIKEPYNKAMVNSIHSVELGDFINAQTPEDVVEIDILYKQEESSVIYSIDTIKHVDKDWHAISNHEGLGLNLGIGKSTMASGSYIAEGGFTKGKYLVTTENIYAALPANQLLRPWDNVPRKALAQEITGNRVVYGNYVQNYDIINRAKISVSYDSRKNNLNTFATHGVPSIKSQRNYQLGVVYCDKYGRETPVFTSSNGAVNIPWQDSGNNKNASKSNQLNANIATNFPEWVDSLKFFVKESSNEYYNLTMERAWVTKSTYEMDDSEGHIWISFPSSDRNKISENDYITLKKKIGAGEKQVSFENKFKVIDIKNEAPDAIKYQLVNLGTSINGDHYAESFTQDDPSSTAQSLLGPYRVSWPAYYDSATGKGPKMLRVNRSHWITEEQNVPLEGESDITGGSAKITTKNLYISWFRNDGGKITSSRKYKIVGGKVAATYYILDLNIPIAREDADIAHVFGDSTQQTQPTKGIYKPLGSDPRDPVTELYDGLVVQIEQRELKESEDFSGKFFVKISKNQITDLITNNNPISILDQFKVQSNAPTWYWQDEIGTNANPENSNWGLLNHGGYPLPIGPGANNIRHHRNNVNSDGTGSNLAAIDFPNAHAQLLTTDWHAPWAGILSVFNPTFFIDSMYMVAGQSDASDYAKYCCITWAGCTQDDNGDTPEDSSWSYPPLKKWFSEFEDISGITGNLEDDSVWLDGNLLSTSELLNENSDWNNLKIDGWIGPLQNVYRHEGAAGTGVNGLNNVNGLEGLVTTSDVHATGPRRWVSGIINNSTEHGAGVDTKVYSRNGETDRHFMHLSFFAPGKDLHDNSWDFSGQSLYGDKSWAANLQGMWGGGVFTGNNPDQVFGTETGHTHLAMEGNYDGNNNPLPEPPGPGVGYGYNENYRELHERQWDPTFTTLGDPENKIRNFIRNLHAGSKFRWHKKNPAGLPDGDNTLGSVADDTVYTIKKVAIKKIYNHTSWRTPYNRWTASEGYNVGGVSAMTGSAATQKALELRSVEEVALDWLNQLPDAGVGGANLNNEANNLKDKIVQFGKSHNRRLCYIIELDKDITDSNSTLGNPASNAEMLNAYFSEDKFIDIEFLDPVVSPLLTDLSKFPAIWETDPKKKDVDLDIYYEASDNIPVRINEKTNEIFAPLGCKVEVLNSSIVGSSIVESWDNNVAIFYPGLPKGDGAGNEIDYTGMSFKFIREDGSYTTAEAGSQSLDGVSTGYKTEFLFRSDVGANIKAGLSWYNCFSFGNGLESNRIKDDFNEVFITNGVKASTTVQQAYKEERRRHGLIYSGLYNSNSGINNLNQFIMAEKITKDLNPTYGSIQKLFSRNTDLISFCEDKVIKILANKDAVFNADGNTQLTATENVLGQTVPFVGDYGISKNPESFASESYRAYFTDKQRGAVLRLSRDGLTPISDAGMKSWFRENLSEYQSLIGTYDSYKEDYNLTLTNNGAFFENLIYDTYLEEGDTLSQLDLGSENRIQNPGVYNGTSLYYLYESYNVIENDNPSNPFDWSPFTQSHYDFTSSVTVTHHAEIPAGSLEPGDDGDSGSSVTTGNPFAFATFKDSSQLDDSGWFYDPYFDGPSNGDIFGPLAGNDHDTEAYSYVYRSFDGESVEEDDPSAHPTIADWMSWSTAQGQTAVYEPHVEKSTDFPANDQNEFNMNKITQCITRTNNASGNDGINGSIIFDRVKDPATAFVEFRDIGRFGQATGDAGALMDEYASNLTPPGVPGDIRHRSFYNGDELHVQFEMECYPTDLSDSGGNSKRQGYNYIIPTLQLMDGGTPIDSSKILDVVGSSKAQVNNADYNPYLYVQAVLHNDTSNMAGQPQVPGFTASKQHAPSSTPGYQLINGKYYSKRFNTTGFATGNTVLWEKTDTIGTLKDTHSSTSQTVVCNASFKFTDPNQSGNNEITDTLAVEDLRIRIWNSEDISSNSMYYHPFDNSDGKYPLRGQLWEIRNLKVKKGFGVTAPHTPDTEQTTTGIGAIAAVDAVPPVKIPAWTEVAHASNYGFGSGSWQISKSDGNNLFRTAAYDGSAYGHDYSATAETGLQQNQIDVSLAPDPNVDTIHYVVPNGFDMVNAIENPPAVTSGITNVSGASFDRTSNLGDLTGNYNNEKITVSQNNDYILLDTVDTTSATHMDLDVSADPLDAAGDTWYLVDVEWDDTYGAGPNLGLFNGGADGNLLVSRVGSVANYSGGGVVDPKGVGTYSGGVTSSNIKMIQTDRTEYGNNDGSGDGKTVLRAVFQVAPDCIKATQVPPTLDVLRITLYGCTNGAKINKIICKKLSNDTGDKWTNWLSTNGTANNWVLEQSASNAEEVVHAFDSKKVYYKNGRLNWDVPHGGNAIISVNNSYKWSQLLDNPPSNTDSSTWLLNFDVRENNAPITGGLRGLIALDDPNNPGNAIEGVYFKDIVDTGHYRVSFTFDGDNTGFEEDGITPVWRMERAPLGSNVYADHTTPPELINTQPFANSMYLLNNIYFSRSNNTETILAVNNISLTSNAQVFTGGSAGSWNFDGFNAAVNDYIFWDSDNNNIRFNNCPAFEDGENKFINVNQQIENTINRYEQYQIQFTHTIDAASLARLDVYYYNSEGWGFKITDVGSSSVISGLPFSFIYETVTIGDSEWSATNIEDGAFNPNLRNAFVIEVNGVAGQTLSGTIDNIRMNRVFVGLEDIEDTTITFNEGVKGWVSFKDFILENGVSVSKKYFTFNKGGLYQHYVSLKQDIDPLSSTFEDYIPTNFDEASNYNRFYNEFYNSNIKTVLNQEPSLIKTFNTINYEGSQAYIIKPPVEEISIHNAAAYQAGEDIDGWTCSEIKTDLDYGTIDEFIKKEGKWFNYIRGFNPDSATVDTSLFSVQGIGVIFAVS